MRKRDRVKIKTLQPGFLLATFKDGHSWNEVFFPPGEWERLQAKGFYGGLILREWQDMRSLTDAELANVGLQRIPDKGASS